MPNPFHGLRPALELMARESQLLPAAGQVIEDLERPDMEETYDRLQTSEDDRLLETLIETPNQEVAKSISPRYRPEHHPFRYFLDGSAKAYFLGTVIENDRAVPIHAAQVGVAAIRREDNGIIRVQSSAHKILLLVPKDQLSYGDKLAETVASAGSQFEFVDTKDGDDPIKSAS